MGVGGITDESSEGLGVDERMGWVEFTARGDSGGGTDGDAADGEAAVGSIGKTRFTVESRKDEKSEAEELLRGEGERNESRNDSMMRRG